MKISRFFFNNFKGIENGVINIVNAYSSNIYTLVGLNESGKTTILEAINSFRAGDGKLGVLYGETTDDIDTQDIIPKSKKGNFNDKIEVGIEFQLDDDDVMVLENHFLTKYSKVLNTESLPRTISVARTWHYKNSAFERITNVWSPNFHLKSKQAKSYKLFKDDSEEWQSAVRILRKKIPQVCYFPTFVFDFPDRIYLSNPPSTANGELNKHYYAVIQDILDSLDDNLTIEEHIIDRIERTVEPNTIFNLFGFMKSDEKKQIDTVLLQASNEITDVVFSNWNKVFGVEIGNKSIDIEWAIEPADDPEKRSVSLKFNIKDGQQTFELSERSLGFRWFFCFLLFTQFRVFRKNSSAIFLFDEPASNLHARAQQQLLTSFNTISQSPNMIVYTTHSHYMIEPSWLEGTYIVINDAIDYNEGAEDNYKIKRVPTKISAVTYRDYANKAENSPTYFQPILDRIDFAPSRIEFRKNSVLVEGKSDFYMLDYFHRVIFGEKYNLCFIPSTSASKLGPVISIYLGWALPFVVMLDDDRAGRTARDSYRKEWVLDKEAVFTIGDLDKNFTKFKLEKLISTEGKAQIAAALGLKKITKKHIAHFFQEKAASGEVFAFDVETTNNVGKVIDTLASIFD